MVAAPQSKSGDPARAAPEPLENGLHLGATEFLRRYEAMPNFKKAGLIDVLLAGDGPKALAKLQEGLGLVEHGEFVAALEKARQQRS